jgi:cytochrome c-type biogenesis protein CcmH/NrfF
MPKCLSRLRKTSVIAVLLAAASIAQESSGIMSADTRRVAGHLACLCKACKNTVGDCAMLECSYCRPKREKIAALQAAGKSDQSIIDAVVAEEGREALAVPPTEGFTLLAWTMPYIAIGFGLIVIWMFVRSLRRRPAATAAAGIDPAVLDRYQDRIDKDTANLD